MDTTDPDSGWLRELIADDGTRALGVRWLAGDDRVDATDVADAHRSGTLQYTEQREADERLRVGRVRIAEGPVLHGRGMAVANPVRWYADSERLYCALGPYYPAWLWVPAGTSVESMTEVLGEMFPKRARDRVGLFRQARGFLGHRDDDLIPNVYDGSMGPIDGLELDRYFAANKYLEPESWGGALLGDPLLDDFGPISPIALLGARRDSGWGQQRVGTVPSMTWRCLHSRSYLSIECRERDLWFTTVRYVPAPTSHAPVVAAANDRFGHHYPADLPLDVVGALTGLPYGTMAELGPHLESPASADILGAALGIYAGLHDGDLAKLLRLRDYARHPDPSIRRRLTMTACWYGLRFLVFELALADNSDEPELAGILERLAAQGGGQGPDIFNAFDDYHDGVPLFADADDSQLEQPTPGADDDLDEDLDEDEDAEVRG